MAGLARLGQQTDSERKVWQGSRKLKRVNGLKLAKIKPTRSLDRGGFYLKRRSMTRENRYGNYSSSVGRAIKLKVHLDTQYQIAGETQAGRLSWTQTLPERDTIAATLLKSSATKCCTKNSITASVLLFVFGMSAGKPYRACVPGKYIASGSYKGSLIRRFDVRMIELTKGQVALVDDEDFEERSEYVGRNCK